MKTRPTNVRLKYTVSKIGSGKTPLGGVDAYVPSGVMLLRSQNIHFDGLHVDDVAFIDDETDEQMSSSRVLPEDVLLNITGASLGRCTIVPKEVARANVNQHVCILRPNQRRVIPEYLNLVLQSSLVQSAIFAGENGSSREGLTFEQIGNLEIVLPPLEQQRAIADFLDRERERLDALITAKERWLELLAEKRRALITHAVTRGLNPAAPLRDSGLPWLGRIPAHWQTKRLRHISNFITVGVVVNPSSYVTDEGVPFLLGGDIREMQIDTTKCKRCSRESSDGPLLKTRLDPGDVVVVRVGYPGVAAVVPPELAGGNVASMMLVRRHERFCSEWLAYAFNAQVGHDQVEIVQYGAAQKQFNISHAVDFSFPFPPLDEQRAIVAHISAETAKLDALRSATERTIGLLKERRSALIAAAVTGKITVPSSDSSGRKGNEHEN